MISFIFGWKQTQESRIKSTGKHKIHREAQSPSRSIKSIAISGRMPPVSRIAILCIPILILMVILQFDLLLLREHSPSLVPLIPTFRTSHPEVTLSDPGGPLLVSMAEVVMLPPQVLPQPTCSPPPLPRLKSFSSECSPVHAQADDSLQEHRSYVSLAVSGGQNLSWPPEQKQINSKWSSRLVASNNTKRKDDLT